MYSAFYRKIRNFGRQKFSWNKSLRSADPKTENFEEFFFMVGSFIVNFAGTTYRIGQIWKVQQEKNYEIMHIKDIIIFI